MRLIFIACPASGWIVPCVRSAPAFGVRGGRT